MRFADTIDNDKDVIVNEDSSLRMQEPAGVTVPLASIIFPGNGSD